MDGALYEGTIKIREAGSAGGFIEIDGIKLAFASQNEVKTRLLKKKRGKYGQAGSSITIPKPQKLTLGADSMANRELLKAALNGGDSDFSVAEAAASNDAVTAVHGQWVFLSPGNEPLEIKPGSVTVQNDSDSVTYVDNSVRHVFCV